MNLGELGHLSYSTLVHPGDDWEDIKASVQSFLPAVKKRVSPDAAFGVSLRLSHASVSALETNPDQREWLKGFLDSQDMYLYTVNAFPYGPFKNRVVMEDVYEPDWTSDERVNYTIAIAHLLAELSPAHISPSIQTAPLAFAPRVKGEAYVESFTHNVLKVVAALWRLEQDTGRRVKLALEPEPACYLETTDETIIYFTQHIYTEKASRALARLGNMPLSEAEGALRRYLGIVFDIGHQAVGFEDIPSSLRSLVAAGIPIFKLQEAAALWVENLSIDVVPGLRRFTDTIYLSQTTLKTSDGLAKYLHLKDALDAYESNPVTTELRCHFHVPVFLEEIGPFRTTRFAVLQALEMHRETPLSDHLEIETYTWDVLPEELKTGDIVDYVTNELLFSIEALTT